MWAAAKDGGTPFTWVRSGGGGLVMRWADQRIDRLTDRLPYLPQRGRQSDMKAARIKNASLKNGTKSLPVWCLKRIERKSICLNVSSAGCEVEHPPHARTPSVDGDVGEEWTPADSPGVRGEQRPAGGRSGFFLCCLKGRRGSRGVAAAAAAAACALIRHSNSAEWRKRKLSFAAHLVASLQVVVVVGRLAHALSGARAPS